jgi:cell wall-associated NlpC family hydrolase
LTAYDRRLHAFRPDLADARLEGEVDAARFVPGKPARVVSHVVDVLREPRAGAGLDTQLLYGDDIEVFDEAGGWAWVQSARDGYVGYVPSPSLGARSDSPTHLVNVPRTFLYPAPDLKLPRRGELSLGSAVAVTDFVETRGTRYALLSTGEAIIATHLRPLGEHASDYVTAAETLLMTPYLWGGATAFGIDCSGLVQLAMRMAGRNVLRDSDMQAAGLGESVEPGTNYSGLRRGDLVFWKGHVAIMADDRTTIHANGHTMMVSREGLAEAIDRIGYLYGGPTGFRRP